ncbi:MAG: hypothetical protein KJP18_04105 [Gemmatimonadetes bacterium]|nr:hypothetical protein [Gemmatimonadota bacterium]NNF39176.1 hypothetical protein [Gemmatimonadota bacterium]
MSIPSRRRRGIRGFRRAATVVGAVGFVGAIVEIGRVFLADGSPLTAATALYAATVAYGMGQMAALRERLVFRPGPPRPRDRAWLWWAVRVVVVLLASTLPAALLLGGLSQR